MIKNRNIANEARRKTVEVQMGTIATSAGNTDAYTIVPCTGVLDSVYFSSLAALTANGTNHVTFSITNLGQAGSGSTALLHATKNTTDSDVTGYFSISANTLQSLYLSATPANLNVTAGDRLLIRVTAAGTLANTVTSPVFCLRYIDQSLS